MKKILMLLTAAVTVLLIGVTALRLSEVTSLVSKLPKEIDLEGVQVKTVGLGELKAASFLPVIQIFIGRAVSLKEVQLSQLLQPSTVSAGGLDLTLPAGWGAQSEYITPDGTTQAVLLRDEDGNFAAISQNTILGTQDPQEFIADAARQYSSLLEPVGFTVTSYVVTMPDGHQAQAVDAQGANLVIQLRAWVSSEDPSKAYLVVLTSSREDILVSQKIFASF